MTVPLGHVYVRWSWSLPFLPEHPARAATSTRVATRIARMALQFSQGHWRVINHLLHQTILGGTFDGHDHVAEKPRMARIGRVFPSAMSRGRAVRSAKARKSVAPP